MSYLLNSVTFDSSFDLGFSVGSSSDGGNVIVRISNSSGSYQNASVGGQIQIV